MLPTDYRIQQQRLQELGEKDWETFWVRDMRRGEEK